MRDQLSIICRASFLFVFIVFMLQKAEAQSPNKIQSMKWGSNLKINLQLSNDSSYILNVDQLPHADQEFGQIVKKYTYYPATLSEDFIQQLKKIKIKNQDSTHQVVSSDKTLWSALHNLIGGEWAHFMNTILYALEKDYLDLKAPLMKRPETNWKPSPVTESYRRTRKWDYYAPINQRHAHKEYKIKKENNNLGGLKDIPKDFIELFQETGNWKYKRMLRKDDRATQRKIAKIDLVKLLVGANYLGKPQIQYIKTMVLKAMNDYSKNQLPSVIIFDNFNAAVAMSLNESGYQLDKVIFSDEDHISEHQKAERKDKIQSIVDNINEVNKNIFQNRLEDYYN